MRSLTLVVGAFIAMEPITAAAHRLVMHGIGSRLHVSHHRVRRSGGFEANDAFPVIFAAIVGVGLWVGFNRPGWGELVPVGVGVTAYGLAYALVHDVYIHGRLGLGGGVLAGRWSWLDRLADAHRVHHRTSRAPYGMLLPVVPRASRAPSSGSRPSHVPADA